MWHRGFHMLWDSGGMASDMPTHRPKRSQPSTHWPSRVEGIIYLLGFSLHSGWYRLGSSAHGLSILRWVCRRSTEESPQRNPSPSQPLAVNVEPFCSAGVAWFGALQARSPKIWWGGWILGVARARRRPRHQIRNHTQGCVGSALPLRKTCHEPVHKQP